MKGDSVACNKQECHQPQCIACEYTCESVQNDPWPDVYTEGLQENHVLLSSHYSEKRHHLLFNDHGHFALGFVDKMISITSRRHLAHHHLTSLHINSGDMCMQGKVQC